MKIELTQILFQIVNFGVVLGVLWYLLYKPVLKIFAERAKRIEEGQKAATLAIKNQEQIEEIKQKTEADARKKAAQTLKEASQEAERQKAVLIEEARQAAATEVSKMKDAWKTEKSQLVQNIRSEVVSAVVSTTEKVVGKSLDSKTHTQLIDQELSAMLKSL